MIAICAKHSLVHKIKNCEKEDKQGNQIPIPTIKQPLALGPVVGLREGSGSNSYKSIVRIKYL